jgi:hypothetical protein
MTHDERLKLLQTWYEKGLALKKAAKAAAWKTTRLIRTVEDLCRLIEADLEQ